MIRGQNSFLGQRLRVPFGVWKLRSDPHAITLEQHGRNELLFKTGEAWDVDADGTFPELTSCADMERDLCLYPVRTIQTAAV